VKIGFLCQIRSFFFGAGGFVTHPENRQAGVNAMASQSLYRKWRSQTFGELVGQEPVIRTLKNALNSGTLAHAYLFTGPRGTGKTSTARLLAKTINCSQAKNGEPCNVCEQCREITAGNSFNVVEIDAASNRGIDSIRELREKVMMPPTTGKYKVYILDEAHMLTVEAFNALLKTLEEPPPHAIFVMATTDVHKMLPTVLSRCQRFDFKRITTRQIVDHLRFIAKQEHVTLESGAAELIARAASGGMRDALSLLDQATAYAGSTITLTQVQAMLGVADPRAIQKFISAVADLDSSAGLHLIHELAEAGADLRQINSQVAEYWRAMMLTKAGANIGEILDHTDDEIREIVRMSQLFALEELTECAKIFAQNELVQRNQGTPQLGLELALLSCLELHRRESGGQAVGASADGSGRRPVSLSGSPSVSKGGTRSGSAQGTIPTAARQEPSPVSQPSIHNVPDVHMPEEQITARPEIASGDQPDLDTMSYPGEYGQSDEELAIQPSPPVKAALSTTPVDLVSPESPPLPNANNTGVHGPDAVMQAEDGGVAASLSLTLQEVKEKWEYIKRRVKSKKDGAMIAALLNGYTVVGIEQDTVSPIVVIRANAAFHYSALQKQAHQETVEWALKLELRQDCKVRMLPPGQGGSSLSIPIPPPPTPPLAINSNSLASHATLAAQEQPPQQSEQRERQTPMPENRVAIPAPSTPFRPKSQQAQTVPPPKEELQVRPDQDGVVVSAPLGNEVSSQSLPLARMTNVRENTARVSTGDSRLIFAQKMARNDQVVQEVMRLFKAEVKDIRLK
jgi:DNA polymerase III subunit gamma/tau